MIITFGQLLEVVAPYLGRGGVKKTALTQQQTRLKAASLLQEYVQRKGTLRKWTVYSRHDIITLPQDLAVILKLKIGEQVEYVHSKWYEFYEQFSQHDFQCENDWKSGVIQEVNTFPTICEMPCGGGYVLAELGRKCGDAEGRYTIIQGKDCEGKDVYTSYDGETIKGERLDLKQEVKKRSATKFSKITDILKNETDDYVKYFIQSNKKSVLESISVLSPKETAGAFRRAKILTPRCDPNKCYKIDILGRVAIKSDYHDNDVIPITNLTAILTLAQAGQAVGTNNLDAANFKYQLLDKQIDDEIEYNRVADASLDICIETSPGSIDHLV